jgi:DNA repair photolyase
MEDRRRLVGRGAGFNPKNRFERIEVRPDAPEAGLETLYLRDTARSIITRNTSPDVGFDASINPYRGCSHGCIYCFARPTHEYLGFSAGLDFESRILVKEDAPELLRRELAAPRWEPRPLALSVATDPYQPVEKQLRLTRRCLEVLAEARHPVAVITKNHLVTRDVDLLCELARYGAVSVAVSLTTLDDDLRRVMEPRTSRPLRRLAAIRKLSAAGVPVGVMIAPIIPGLTDHEIPQLLSAAAEAGARFAGHTPVRLPHAVAPLFEDWLERHYPAAKEKVLGRIRSIRGGRLNDPRFGTRMRGEGPYADHIHQLFRLSARKAGLDGKRRPLSTTAFRRPGEQPRLF